MEANVVLNYTLKTASPKPIANESMRFFDTPGYFFHLEVGRNLLSPRCFACQLKAKRTYWLYVLGDCPEAE